MTGRSFTRILLMPLAALLVLLAAASPTSAQFFSRQYPFRLFGGYAIATATDLYHGTITVEHLTTTETGEERMVQDRAQYRETLGRPEEYLLGVEVGFGRDHGIALRGRAGRSASTALYTGGSAPQTVARSAEWLGAELIGRLRVLSIGPATLSARVGASLTRWTLDTGGVGPRAVYRFTGADADARWSDRSWSTPGVVMGGRLSVEIRRSLRLELGVEERISYVPGSPFRRATGADLRPAGGDWRSLTYSHDAAEMRVLSIGADWRFGRVDRPDPGPAAIAAVAADPPASDSADTRARLPADVRDHLAEGDTLAAIRALERVVSAGREDAIVLGTLGELLAPRVSAVESEFADRERVERLLHRALELDPGNPRYLLALSVLYDRRGTPSEARTVARRAMEAAAERPHDLSPGELAEAFYRRGSTLERHVREFENLRFLGTEDPPISTPECADAGAFCLNWARPRAFFEWFEPRTDLTSLVAEQRAAMLEEYRRALELAPAHRRANRALLAAHARQNDWDAFLRVARRYVEAAPDEPWARLFLAAGLYWTDRADSAAALVAEAVPLLPERDRAVFEDLRPLLRAEGALAEAWDTIAPGERDLVRNVYWRRADPLYLTDANERETAHHSRVALAELLFGEPQRGHNGWETDRGQILVRYGRPETVWQIQRERGASTVGVGTAGGGRWIFWNYRPDAPSFIFEKELGRLSVRHMPASMSAYAAEELAKTRPTAFEPPFRLVGEIPHQLARFRSADSPNRYEVEVHARPPATALTAVPGDAIGGDAPAAGRTDSLETGLFVFQGDAHARVGAARRREPADNDVRRYRVVLPPGIYSYALEALAADSSAAALSRGEVVVGAYSTNSLRLSDLLVAWEVEPLADEPRTRQDLRYAAMPCLRIPPSGRVGVVFEAYGLGTDAEGLARYRVEVSTGEAPVDNLAVRLLRGIRDLFRDAPTGRLSYERTVVPDGDRSVEWFEVEIPEDAGEEVELTIEVTDLILDATDTRRRVLRAGPCASANGNPQDEG